MDVLTTYKPLVSIVLTCYNGEKFLPRCFDSIDGQTYKNLEVIFVDDGSIDNSYEIIKNFCAERENYTCVKTENRGVGSAKKLGLEMAIGEYISFCDIDDVLSPYHIEYLLTILLRNNAQMSISKFKMVNPRFAVKNKVKTKKEKLYKSKQIYYDKINGIQEFFSQEKFDFILMNKLFKMEIIKKSNATFLEGCRYGEETPLIYNYLKNCDKIVYGDVATYYYVQWKSSLMHASFNKNRLDLYTNINSYIDDCKEKYPEVYPYIHSMRAGYAVGFLYFILKSKFKEADVIKLIINLLNEDCKYLKKCKKTALYKRIFIPVVLFIAKIRFRKALKQK